MPFGHGDFLGKVLDNATQAEESELTKGDFVATMGKLYTVLLSVGGAVMVCLGLPIVFFADPFVGALFLILAACSLLFLPTIVSYKCFVSKTTLKEEYWILFIKVINEVSWDEIRYKKLRYGQNNSITFYNADKKKLIAFDGAVVGYGRIVKMAKRSTIREINHPEKEFL